MEKLTSSPSCNPLNPYNARAVCEHQTPKTTEDRLSAPIAALLTLAERWGPNAERVKAIRDERDAYSYLSLIDRNNPSIMQQNTGWSCKGMEAQYQTVQNELKLGQLAYGKILFTERKKTPAQVLNIVRAQK